MNTIRVAGTTFALLALLLLTACQMSAEAESQEPIATDRIEMPPSYRFDPPTITVKVGTEVTFHNSDHFTHTVRLKDGSGVDKVVKPGESTTIIFDQVGEIDYDCGFHPNDMSGTVIVTP